MLCVAVAPRAIGARSSTDIGMVIELALRRRLLPAILAPAPGGASGRGGHPASMARPPRRARMRSPSSAGGRAVLHGGAEHPLQARGERRPAMRVAREADVVRTEPGEQSIVQ